MTLYALDPGTDQSALVSVESNGCIDGEVMPNDELLLALEEVYQRGHLVIEEIASYGMPVGREVFQTVFWAGRFAQAWDGHGYPWSLLLRQES